MDPVTATAAFVFWFWALVGVFTIALICAIEWDKGVFATVLLIGSAALLQFAFHVPIFQYIWENPLASVGWFFGWFAVGTVYAMTRWELFIRNQRHGYDELKAKFLTKNHVDPTLAVIPLELRGDWKQYSRRLISSTEDYPQGVVVFPRPGQYKSRIYMWIAYWPWSLLWTAINDPVRKLVKGIYRSIASFLERRSKRVFAGTEQDFQEQEV